MGHSRFPMEQRTRLLCLAESRLKHLLSVFYTMKQVFISRLKAERWGENLLIEGGD
jgi:hypothetical protein